MWVAEACEESRKEKGGKDRVRIDEQNMEIRWALVCRPSCLDFAPRKFSLREPGPYPFSWWVSRPSHARSPEPVGVASSALTHFALLQRTGKKPTLFYDQEKCVPLTNQRRISSFRSQTRMSFSTLPKNHHHRMCSRSKTERLSSITNAVARFFFFFSCWSLDRWCIPAAYFVRSISPASSAPFAATSAD